MSIEAAPSNQPITQEMQGLDPAQAEGQNPDVQSFIEALPGEDMNHKLAGVANSLEEVPASLEDADAYVAATGYLRQGLTQNPKGHYHFQGEVVEKAVAESIITKSEQGLDAWKLGSDQRVKLQQAVSTEHIADLPKDLRNVVRAGKTDPMEPDFMAFKRFKGEVGNRLSLDSAITSRENSQSAAASKESHDAHSAKAAELRSKREQLIADKARTEVNGVRTAAETKVLTEELKRVDALVTEEAGKNPDKLNLHYMRQQLLAEARAKAAAAGSNAAKAREQQIDTHGGAAALSSLKTAEAKAAEKDAFLRRLHGNDYDKPQVTHDKQPEPDYAKLNRPDSVSYKDWTSMTPRERQQAIDSAANTAPDKSADPARTEPAQPNTRPTLRNRIKGALQERRTDRANKKAADKHAKELVAADKAYNKGTQPVATPAQPHLKRVAAKEATNTTRTSAGEIWGNRKGSAKIREAEKIAKRITKLNAAAEARDAAKKTAQEQRKLNEEYKQERRDARADRKEVRRALARHLGRSVLTASGTVTTEAARRAYEASGNGKDKVVAGTKTAATNSRRAYYAARSANAYRRFNTEAGDKFLNKSLR